MWNQNHNYAPQNPYYNANTSGHQNQNYGAGYIHGIQDQPNGFQQQPFQLQPQPLPYPPQQQLQSQYQQQPFQVPAPPFQPQYQQQPLQTPAPPTPCHFNDYNYGNQSGYSTPVPSQVFSNPLANMLPLVLTESESSSNSTQQSSEAGGIDSELIPNSATLEEQPIISAPSPILEPIGTIKKRRLVVKEKETGLVATTAQLFRGENHLDSTGPEVEVSQPDRVDDLNFCLPVIPVKRKRVNPEDIAESDYPFELLAHQMKLVLHKHGRDVQVENFDQRYHGTSEEMSEGFLFVRPFEEGLVSFMSVEDLISRLHSYSGNFLQLICPGWFQRVIETAKKFPSHFRVTHGNKTITMSRGSIPFPAIENKLPRDGSIFRVGMYSQRLMGPPGKWPEKRYKGILRAQLERRRGVLLESLRVCLPTDLTDENQGLHSQTEIITAAIMIMSSITPKALHEAFRNAYGEKFSFSRVRKYFLNEEEFLRDIEGKGVVVRRLPGETNEKKSSATSSGASSQAKSTRQK